MARGRSSYHRDVAAMKRESILVAATPLFLENGYDRTSLAQIAQQAGVSRATLFKQFPTKAALFEAAVLAAGRAAAPEPVDVDVAGLHAGLVTLGRAYAQLLTRPEMEALMRTVIAESPGSPSCESSPSTSARCLCSARWSATCARRTTQGSPRSMTRRWHPRSSWG